MPETLIVSGDVGALLVMIRLAVKEPAYVGVKRIVSTNDMPGGTDLLVGRALNAGLDELRSWIARVSMPVFAIKTVVSLNWPIFTLPEKATTFDENEAAGAGRMTGVPVYTPEAVPASTEPVSRART